MRSSKTALTAGERAEYHSVMRGRPPDDSNSLNVHNLRPRFGISNSISVSQKCDVSRTFFLALYHNFVILHYFNNGNRL